MSSYEYRDGQLVPVSDTVISEDCELRAPVTSTLTIQAGVSVVALGNINGSVNVLQGASLEAYGDVNGTVSADSDARITFHGRATGTIHLASGGLAHFSKGAVALGTMRIEGTLINEGTRGINVSGAGQIEDREGSSVRYPDSASDTAEVYRD